MTQPETPIPSASAADASNASEPRPGQVSMKLFARTGSGTVIGGVIVAPRASELILPIAIAVSRGESRDNGRA